LPRLLPVSFRNTTLFLVDIDGVPYTPMKPIVEGMGISWQGQHEKLNENKARWGIKIILIPTDGGQQAAICLPLRKLPGWLMTTQMQGEDQRFATCIEEISTQMPETYSRFRTRIAVDFLPGITPQK
jgi:hypothetical protein